MVMGWGVKGASRLTTGSIGVIGVIEVGAGVAIVAPPLSALPASLASITGPIECSMDGRGQLKIFAASARNCRKSGTQPLERSGSSG